MSGNKAKMGEIMNQMNQIRTLKLGFKWAKDHVGAQIKFLLKKEEKIILLKKRKSCINQKLDACFYCFYCFYIYLKVQTTYTGSQGNSEMPSKGLKRWPCGIKMATPRQFLNLCFDSGILAKTFRYLSMKKLPFLDSFLANFSAPKNPLVDHISFTINYRPKKSGAYLVIPVISRGIAIDFWSCSIVGPSVEHA